VFCEWTPGDQICWDRNPNWFDGPAPFFDRVEAKLFSDGQTIIDALASGDLDWSLLDAGVFDQAQSSLDSAGTHFFVPSNTISALNFNFDNDGGRWRDPRLRQALSMALDRDTLVGALDPTFHGEWQSHLPPSMTPWFVSPRHEAFGEAAVKFQHDPDSARQLISEVTGEDSLSLVLTVPDTPSVSSELLQKLTDQLGAAGFMADVRVQEFSEYLTTTALGEIPEGIGLGRRGSGYDPDELLMGSYASWGSSRMWAGTPIDEMEQLEALFVQQRVTLDFDERLALIEEIQRLMGEAMLTVPLHAPAGYGYIQPWMLDMFYKNSPAVHRESVAEASFTADRIADMG
jgi:ABC-type transport system substrate-binding protein